MRVVVTGGAGFVGSHVVRALRARGDAVLVVDDLSRGKRANLPRGVPLCVADIRSAEAHAAMQAFAPEGLCHLAAQMDVGASVRAPVADADVNVLGTLHVVQAAVRAGARTLVSASSGGAVYGDAASLPSNETTACAPASPYGVSKQCSELYVSWAARSAGVRGVSLRLANVYGPRQSHVGEAGVVAIFAERMLRGEAPRIYGDGLQTRDFVYVGDVAAAFVAALHAPAATGELNVGTGVQTSLLQLVQQLANVTGYAGDIVHAAGKPGEVRRSALACARAQALLGWRAATPLPQGLAATVAALRVAAAGPVADACLPRRGAADDHHASA